ncbi:putative Dipeptidyl aminopeptidase BIII [Alphaproteobacteria bacterium]
MKKGLLYFLMLFLIIGMLWNSTNKGTTKDITTKESDEKNNIIAKENASQNLEELIPRREIFGRLEIDSVQVSPDGRYISYIAPYNGVSNVYVASINDIKDAHIIVKDAHSGILFYSWAQNSKQILYTQRVGDDVSAEEYIYVVNIDGTQAVNLSLLKSTRVFLEKTSEKYPNEILVRITKRDSRFFDIYKIDITSGETTLLLKNDEMHNYDTGIITDDDFRIRFVNKTDSGGKTTIYKVTNYDEIAHDKNAKLQIEPFMEIPVEDNFTTNIWGFTEDSNKIYVQDSRGKNNTAALYTYDLTKNEKTSVYHNQKTDVRDIWTNYQGKLLAVQDDYLEPQWHIIDTSIKDDFQKLFTLDKGMPAVVSTSQNNKFWVVVYNRIDMPQKYYLYNRELHSAYSIGSTIPTLEKYKFSQVYPVIIRARDGLDLVSYLTIPNHIAPHIEYSGTELSSKIPSPMVLLVHGGPHENVAFRWYPTAQWLANRGYVVLQVNYRGSTRFGKNFISASYGEWGNKMQNDLVDATEWAIKKGIAFKDKIAIFGAGYGGYAALAGLTLAPDVFACGINVGGPANLVTFLENIPTSFYWGRSFTLLNKSVGGAETEEKKKMLLQKSPITYIGNIKKPLLIAQEANNKTMQTESEQIIKAMKKNNIPIAYVLYPDGIQNLQKSQNKLSLYAMAEQFLHMHLQDGRYEPLGLDLKNSSAQIREEEQ